MWQLLYNQVAGACDEGGGMRVREKIEKDGGEKSSTDLWQAKGQLMQSSF